MLQSIKQKLVEIIESVDILQEFKESSVSSEIIEGFKKELTEKGLYDLRKHLLKIEQVEAEKEQSAQEERKRKDQAFSLNDQAVQLCENGHFTDAINMLKEVIALAPEVPVYKKNLAVAFYNYGNFYFDEGLYEKALEQYHEGLVLGVKSVGDDHFHNKIK